MKRLVYLSILLQLFTTSYTYFIGSTSMKSIADAQAQCQQFGTDYHLASIHNLREFNEARDICDIQRDVNSHSCWIGLSNNANGVYSWTDGTPIDFGFDDGSPTTGQIPWNAGYPSGTNQCILLKIKTGYLWQSVSCSITSKIWVLCDSPRTGNITVDTANWSTVSTVSYTRDGNTIRLSGEVKWKDQNVLFGQGSTGYIGQISHYSAYPLNEEIFTISNQNGVETLIVIKTDGKIYLKSWTIPIGYYNVFNQKFYYLTTTGLPQDWIDIIISSDATQYQPSQMDLVAFCGISFIRNGDITNLGAFTSRTVNIDRPNEDEPNENKPTINYFDKLPSVSFIILIFIYGIGTGIGLKLISCCSQKNT